MTAQKLLIIVGPTASGKSGLAVALAKKFNGEVISADSRQVYRGLNLGTGKVTKREMDGVRHHLLDVASPKKTFSAQDFIDHATASLEEMRGRGALPIVAGGTGFYIDVLVGRIQLAHVAPNPAIRARLATKSTEELYTLLAKRDPVRAATMATPSERNNKVRLIRALEIAAVQRGSIHQRAIPQFECCWIGIKPDMKLLETKIRARLKERIRKGMIREARALHEGGLSYKRMEELGLEYRSLAHFLQKKISRSEMEEELYLAIRRYAHKQITYWRRNADIRWFTSARDIKNIETYVQKF